MPDKAGAEPSGPRPFSLPLFLLRGAAYGAAAGAGAAAVYMALVIPITLLGILVSNLDTGRLSEAVIGAVLLPVCMVPFGIILGVVPSLLVGAVGGLLIGLALALVRQLLTPWRAILTGGAVGLALVLLAHAIALPGGTGGLGLWEYAFWLGGPSVLVIPAAALVARALYHTARV